MFFFEKNKSEITFEIDDHRLQDFNQALSILGLTKEEAFDRFLSLLIHEALAPASEKEESVSEESKPGSKRLSQETIKSRIAAWAAKPRCYPHIMIKAFFAAGLNYDIKEPLREKMLFHFNDFVGVENLKDETVSKQIFRQMCSNAARAYGDVFIYNRRKETVSLNPTYEFTIMSFMDKFIDAEETVTLSNE